METDNSDRPVRPVRGPSLIKYKLRKAFVPPVYPDDPRFNAEAPPRDWVLQHNHHSDRHVPINRPVPRHASAHYYNEELTASATSFYLY